MSQSHVRVDHHYQGATDGIASYVIPDDELTLIEAGPASTTETLLAGIRGAGFDPLDVRRVLLTHIHLDHAGASGILARRLPHARFYVHPRGAKHLIDPSRLVASAERIYGDRMAELWGEILPVPAERVVIVNDGEMIGRLRAVDTPGHAVHHHAYHDSETGSLYTGDVGGVRMQGVKHVRPPTPPPELDLEAWASSIARIRALAPRRLCLTHFGEFEDVDWHIADLEHRLAQWRDWLRADLDASVLASRERDAMTAEDAVRYERVGSYQMCVEGFPGISRSARQPVVDIRQYIVEYHSMDLLQGTLDLLILKTLALGPLHGWGISKRLRQISGEALEVGQGSLYPALYRLEDRGWVASDWQHSPEGRRVKFYNLTAVGRKQFATERKEWRLFASAVEQVLSAT